MAKDSIESKYQSIVERNADSLESGGRKAAILILGLILGSLLTFSFVNSDLSSPTGLFAGNENIEEPIIVSNDLRNVEVKESAIEFELNSDIKNSNLMEANVQRVSHNISLGSHTLGSGKRWGVGKIEPGKTEEIVTIHKTEPHEVDFDELPKESKLVIEGNIAFDIADQTISKKFRHIHYIENN